MTDYLTDARNDIKAYFETHDIPTYFYQCLFGEFVKIWGINFLIPDKYYGAEYDDDGNLIKCDDDKYLYQYQVRSFVTYISGTAGWELVFKEACDQCGIMDIYADYSQMNWMHSDIFDGYIADKMLEIIFDDPHHNDYFEFKMRKEIAND